VPGVNLATIDRELRDAGERVVLSVREAGDRKRLPVRRADDERAQQHDRANGEARDLPVHRRSPPSQVVLVGREKQTMQGRRPRS
jgi:hypothetical protein